MTMAGIPKLPSSPRMGEISSRTVEGTTSTVASHTDASLLASDPNPDTAHVPRSFLQSRLVQTVQAQKDAMLLAQHPERIANQLVKDAEFRQAYVAFIDQLTRLSNGSIEMHDEEALRRTNALIHRGRLEEEWGDATYSAALSRLPKLKNPAVTTIAGSVDRAVDELILTMQAMPEKRLLWLINGNNHFPTHQGLKPILRKIAEVRAAQGLARRQEKDVILISGNAAGRTPFSPGPVVKYMDKEGEFVGDSSEAEAIESLLKDPLIAEHFVFELEKRAINTRENIRYTNHRLKKSNETMADFITVNSQSGFSGLRSALTLFGTANTREFPAKVHLVNPDIGPKDSVDASDYATTGKTVIQAMREFMNLTADVSRSFFIPQVPLPQELIDSFKTCLRKMHIDPDAMTSDEVQRLLRNMHETAMLPNEKKLVNPEEGYASAVEAYAKDSKKLRAKQNVAQKIVDRRVRNKERTGTVGHDE
jgi:hypothetical protein